MPPSPAAKSSALKGKKTTIRDAADPQVNLQMQTKQATASASLQVKFKAGTKQEKSPKAPDKKGDNDVLHSCLKNSNGLDSPNDLNKALEQAVRDGDEQVVAQILEMRADPGAKLGKFQFPENTGKQFMFGSLVHIAAMSGRTEIMRILVESRADLRAKYGFVAGAEKIQWEASTIFAAVPAGNMTMVGEILELNADIDDKSSLNATPLLEAVYFGHVSIVSFLLGQQADLTVSAFSQDSGDIHYNVMQLAARKGDVDICQELISAKADFQERNASNRMYSPLDYAVECGHADVVKLLICNSAELLEQVHFFLPTMTQTKTQESEADVHLLRRTLESVPDIDGKGVKSARSLDLLFNTQNPILYAAAAAGLCEAPVTVRKQLTSEDCMKFLETPGDAPPFILQSIFCDTEAIRYWHNSRKGQERVEATSAYFSCPVLFPNAAVGPPMKELKKMFTKFESPDKLISRKFFKRLIPQSSDSRSEIMMSVQMSQCLLPNIHRDIRWLMAIRGARNEAVYDVPGCQALIVYASRRHNVCLGIELVTRFTILVLLSILTVGLREAVEVGSPKIWATIILTLCGVEIYTELLQVLGCVNLGISRAYFCDWSNWVDWLALVTTCGMSVLILQKGTRFQESILRRMMMATLVLIRWGKALFGLRTFPRFGVTMLPIVYSIYDVGNFCAVLMLYICGFAHAYASLGIPGQDSLSSFMIAYRLGLLADFELDELEGADEETTSDYQDAGLHIVMRVLVIAATFLIAITVMNVFIAVLSNIYTQYADNWKRLMLQIKTDNAIDGMVLWEGFSFLTSCFCCREHLHDAVNSAFGTQRLADEEYLWICCPKKEKGSEEDVGEADLRLAIEQIRNDTAIEVSRVYDQVSKLEQAVDRRMNQQAQQLESISQQLSALSGSSVPRMNSMMVPSTSEMVQEDALQPKKTRSRKVKNPKSTDSLQSEDGVKRMNSE